LGLQAFGLTTGRARRHEQWKKLADICETKKAVIVFDTAYQGYASGDLDKVCRTPSPNPKPQTGALCRTLSPPAGTPAFT